MKTNVSCSVIRSLGVIGSLPIRKNQHIFCLGMNKETSSFSGSEHFRYEAHDLEAMRAAVNYYRWILQLFNPYKGKHILEVGAGTGTFGSVMLDEWQNELRRYTALEPDPVLYEQLSIGAVNIPEINVRYHNGFLSDLYLTLSKESIDTILYVNVLEHVEDDRTELEQAAHVLEKGGHLLTFTPAMPCLYSPFDKKLGHYRRYPLHTMKQRIRKTGLKIVKAHYVDFPGFFLWWLKYKMLRHTTMRKEQVRLYDRFAVPLLMNLEPSRYLPFGKNIVVAGKKT